MPDHRRAVSLGYVSVPETLAPTFSDVRASGRQGSADLPKDRRLTDSVAKPSWRPILYLDTVHKYGVQTGSSEELDGCG